MFYTKKNNYMISNAFVLFYLKLKKKVSTFLDGEKVWGDGSF